MSIRNLFAAVLAIAGLASAVSAQPIGLEGVDPAWQDYRASFEPGRCPFDGDYDRDIISCGTVLVPEDRRDPASRLIALAVMRVAPTDKAVGDQAIVRLTGGPGFAAVLPGRAEYFSGPDGEALRDIAELIYFDQRGTGESEGRFCKGLREFYQYGARGTEEGLRRSREDRQRCIAAAREAGIATDAYTNWQNALDVRDLRMALGFAQWNLLGVSYGTQLGQGVMMVDPEGVRSAVLDSVVQNSDGPVRTGSFGENFEQSIAGVMAACKAAPSCAKAFPDLDERLYRVIEGFGERPLKLTGLDPVIFANGEVVVDDVAFANLVFQLLYRRPLYGDLGLLLEAAETRNLAALRAYADAGAPGVERTHGGGMAATIECADQPAAIKADRRRDREMAPRTWQWFEKVTEPCIDSLALALEPTARALTSDIPTLIAVGMNDPITPWQDGKAVADRLTNVHYVEFPHTGHGALFSTEECGDQILGDFIANPTGDLDTTCAADTRAPEFATNWRSTGKTYRLVSAVQDGARPVVPLAIVALLLASLVFYPVAALGRRVDARRGRSVQAGLARARWASWTGAVVALGGLGLAVWIVRGWITAHPLGLPVGVPTSVMWGGLLATAGVVLAGLGAWLTWRRAREVPSGTLAASAATLLGALGMLWFMTANGVGPVVL